VTLNSVLPRPCAYLTEASNTIRARFPIRGQSSRGSASIKRRSTASLVVNPRARPARRSSTHIAISNRYGSRCLLMISRQSREVSCKRFLHCSSFAIKALSLQSLISKLTPRMGRRSCWHPLIAPARTARHRSRYFETKWGTVGSRSGLSIAAGAHSTPQAYVALKSERFR
jgi:hypothetical protein